MLSLFPQNNPLQSLSNLLLFTVITNSSIEATNDTKHTITPATSNFKITYNNGNIRINNPEVLLK